MKCFREIALVNRASLERAFSRAGFSLFALRKQKQKTQPDRRKPETNAGFPQRVRPMINMQIREYRESDLAALRAIHAAQGFDYPLPDLRAPLFMTKLVLTNDAPGNVNSSLSRGLCAMNLPIAASSELADGKQGNADQGRNEQGSGEQERAEQGKAERENLLGAAFLRLTAEAYLLLDPRLGTPHDRWRALLTLHAAAEREAWRRGLEDVHAWLPPPIAKNFGKRLARMGWLRDDTWTPYCRRLAPPP